jgi:hypothetical protein
MPTGGIAIGVKVPLEHVSTSAPLSFLSGLVESADAFFAGAIAISDMIAMN